MKPFFALAAFWFIALSAFSQNPIHENMRIADTIIAINANSQIKILIPANEFWATSNHPGCVNVSASEPALVKSYLLTSTCSEVQKVTFYRGKHAPQYLTDYPLLDVPRPEEK